MLRSLHERLERYCCQHLHDEPMTLRFRLASKLEYILRRLFFMNSYWFKVESHYPLLIKTEDGEVKVCERPEDLPTGRGFRVVATNREIVI